MPNLITSAEAAALCNMTTYAFRKAMIKQEALITAKIKKGNMYFFDQAKVEAWNTTRRKYKRRTS